MKTIYAVVGQEGAYSDYSTWVICAYETRADADLHVERLFAFSEIVKADKKAKDAGYNVKFPTELDTKEVDAWTYPDREYSVDELLLRDVVPT